MPQHTFTDADTKTILKNALNANFDELYTRPVITKTGFNVAAAGSSYDFAAADFMILPDGMTIQVRNGAREELLPVILAQAELGYTNDTVQLFAGDGVTQGGRQIGLQRYFASGWTGGDLSTLLGAATAPDIVLITGDNSDLFVVGSSGSTWIPLIRYKRQAIGEASSATSALLDFRCRGSGVSSGSGTVGSGSVIGIPFIQAIAGKGGDTTTGSSGNGGIGGLIGTTISLTGGDGGNSVGPANGGGGGQIFRLIAGTTGNGGTGNAAAGGNGGTADQPMLISTGNGGNGGSDVTATGGSGGHIVGATVVLRSGSGGNGGTAAGAAGGAGGNVNNNTFISQGGNGGNGGSFAGGKGGNGGRINLVGAAGGAGTGSSVGGAGGAGGLLAMNGGAGNLNGGVGGAAGSITVNGGAATAGFNGGVGGSMNLNGAAATGSSAGANGGSITLSGGVNTIRTSGVAQYTHSLPTTTANGSLATLPLMTGNQTGTIAFNANGQNETIFNSSATTIASATIALPTTSIPGQILRYISAGEISAITMTGGIVDIGSAPAALPAQGVLVWQCHAAGHFVRLQ